MIIVIFILVLCVINNCAKDVKECLDGSYVGRYGPNCEFSPCHCDDVNCPSDIKYCSDGSYVGRDPYNNCKFIPCAADDVPVCKMLSCVQMENIKRDPFNNCEFVSCQKVIVIVQMITLCV